jgi:plasmid stability protein
MAQAAQRDYEIPSRAVEHRRSADCDYREILRQALATEPRQSFKEQAARVRLKTAGRKHTPLEGPFHEGRDER